MPCASTGRTDDMNNVVILLDSLENWAPYCQTSSIMTSSEYLESKTLGKEALLVINLSSEYGNNSEGYYCSLLAQARGHKVLPSVDTLNKLDNGVSIRMSDALQKSCYQWIRKNKIPEGTWNFNIYFGKCREKGLERIARFLFDNYPVPILNIEMNTRPRNQIEAVRSVPLSTLANGEQDCFANALDEFNKKIWRVPRLSRHMRYSLAILHDPQEKLPPSNKKALGRFLDVAKKMGINAELITEEDSPRLMEFDALFIRTTTTPHHYTYRLAQMAHQNGMVVIDDPVSIVRCTNKVYLYELLARARVPVPASQLIFRSNPGSFEDIAGQLGTPFIVKIPDGSFSLGVHKVSCEDDFTAAAEALFANSAIILAQEFIPTEFDWRIGVLGGETLFACKYHMAKGHWQIYNHACKGKDQTGLVTTLPLYQVPRKVVRTALKATSLIGKGLYGVDLKEVNGKVVVIEVNDNPNIDYKIEDAILGDELYYRVLNYFMRSLELQSR